MEDQTQNVGEWPLKVRKEIASILSFMAGRLKRHGIPIDSLTFIAVEGDNVGVTTSETDRDRFITTLLNVMAQYDFQKGEASNGNHAGNGGTQDHPEADRE